MTRTPRTFLAVLAAGALTLAACGDDDGGSGVGLKVANAWARQSPAATTLGAAYMDLTSEKDDALVGASVDASIAGKVEIHEMVMADSSSTTMGGMTETTMGPMTGEMVMREVDKIDLPAGQTVSLEPGGYHVMLIDLVAPLTVGQKFDVTLRLESGATVTTEVEVREDAP
jgi:hypothetical protein